MYLIYDIEMIKERIKSLRKNRWNLYKTSQNADITLAKYACCKTQETLADKLDLERRTIGSWERGATSPSLENLISLCNLLDCNIEYFLGADELPYIDTIAKASHFTGINPKIIEYASKNPDYLDCLNFFMLPENCSEIFNNITLSMWKEYWINQSLSDIKPPLIDIIKKAFKDFYSFTPFDKISINKYKEYLMNNLPIEQINFKSKPEKGGLVNVKEVFSFLRYKDCIKHFSSGNQYDDFINYIAELTYEPLTNEEFIEIQKKKVANKFIEILSLYLSNI